jgi:DNA-binding MarR family transcriptional regulator
VTPPPQLLLLDLYVTSQLAGSLIDHELKGSGLTAEEFALSSVLGHEEELTPTELAARLGIPLSSAIFRVSKLIERGHAERRPNPRDRRSALLALTDEGRAAHERARPAFARVLERVRQHLARSPEEVQLALRALAAASSAALAEVKDEELIRSRAA